MDAIAVIVCAAAIYACIFVMKNSRAVVRIPIYETCQDISLEIGRCCKLNIVPYAQFKSVILQNVRVDADFSQDAGYKIEANFRTCNPDLLALV